MNILFTAQGSRGDVYPIITLLECFKKQGHDVTLVSNINFRTLLEQKKITSYFFKVDMTEAMAEMKSGMSSILPTLKWVQGTISEQMEILLDLSKSADCIISTNNEFSIPTVCEYRKIPAFRLAYIPVLPGSHPPPLLPSQKMPVLINRLCWKALDKGLDALALKTINEWRNRLEMDSLKSLGPQLAENFFTCMAFHNELAPPQDEWDRGKYKYTGYCFEDQKEELDADLNKFILKGSAPIYVGFGSVTIPNPQKISRKFIEAARLAGIRLVISRGWTGLGTEINPSENVFITGPCSHDKLFPLMAGICHHGGAGTTHRAARAGVPQVIFPQFADQYFWADRVAKLNLGPKTKSLKNITALELSRYFEKICQQNKFKNESIEFAGHFKDDQGAETAYTQIMMHIEQRKSCTA